MDNENLAITLIALHRLIWAARGQQNMGMAWKAQRAYDAIKKDRVTDELKRELSEIRKELG